MRPHLDPPLRGEEREDRDREARVRCRDAIHRTLLGREHRILNREYRILKERIKGGDDNITVIPEEAGIPHSVIPRAGGESRGFYYDCFFLDPGIRRDDGRS
jgi:hypothetical protein